jgi:hypothetical protein
MKLLKWNWKQIYKMIKPSEPYKKYEQRIWVYKNEGLSIIRAIKQLHEECLSVEGGLGMAKEIVSSHPAYSPIHEAARPLHEAAFAAAGVLSLEDAEETPPPK